MTEKLSSVVPDTEVLTTPETLDLQAIRERCGAASPGPWVAELDVFDAADQSIEACVSNDSTRHADMMLFSSETPFFAREGNSPEWARARQSQEMRDAEFIAHSRTDVPALLSRVEDLENRLRRAEQRAKNSSNTAKDYCSRLRTAESRLDAVTRERDAILEVAKSATNFWNLPNVGWPIGIPDAFISRMDNLAEAVRLANLSAGAGSSPDLTRDET